MIWKDGGDYGILYREIANKDGRHAICRVKVRQLPHHARSTNRKNTRPYPPGEANFRLILAAPLMLAALERMIEVYEAHFEPLPDGQQPEGAYTQARAAIAAAKGEGDDVS